MIHVDKDKCFTCDECPIVKQLDRRLKIAQDHPEFGDFQYDHCGCDKIDAEFFMGGYCEDAWKSPPPNKSMGYRKTGRAYRRRATQKKKTQKVDQSKRFYCGCWVDDREVLHYPKSSRHRVFWKKYANKLFRKCTDEYFPKGNTYRKAFDSWTINDW